MAIVLTSGNLNEWGNAGNFETDRSTWGFSNPPNITITRNGSESVLGSSSAQAVLGLNGSDFTISDIGKVSTSDTTKTYIIKAKVKTPSAHVIGSDASVISFHNAFDLLTDIAHTNVTVAACKDSWQEITYQFSTPFSFGIGVNIYLSGSLYINGQLLIDQLEIFEYVDVPYSCTLAATIAVTNASGPSTADGNATITVSTGTSPYEYSKDNGATWQPSNYFAGLLPGTYYFKVRETSVISCVVDLPSLINYVSPGFDWGYVKTDETISGSNDGSVVITPTVAGTYTYSKDGGATYQVSNNFTGLAPGTYLFVVKKTSDGSFVSKAIVIAAGVVLFERMWFFRNPVFYAKAATPGWGVLVNYRLYDEIRVEDVAGSSVFNKKMDVALYPDAAGNVVFLVAEAFRGVLDAVPPVLNTSAMLRLTDRIKVFKHFTGELQNTDMVPSTLTESLPHMVLLGGLSKQQWAQVDYFGDYLPTNKKFMTWAPDSKPVDRGQEDYLNFYVYGTLTTQLKLHVKAYFDDGTNQTSTILTQTVEYGQLIQIPAGPANCGVLLIDVTKNVVKYEVSLLDQDNSLISEVRTYLIDLISHPRKRLFMFLNSLGAYEVLRFTGVAQTSVDVTKTEIAKFLPYTYSSLDGEREVDTSSLRVSTEFSTGYFGDKNAAAWLDYMQDLLLSKRVFNVTDGQRRPVLIAGGKVNLNADQNFERFIRFSAVDAYTDESYTPMVI